MSVTIKHAPLKIFLSYATGDAAYADELSTLLRENFGAAISIFRDRPSQGRVDHSVGLENWVARLGEALRDADLIVCVVTPSFLTSRWFFMEAGGGLLFGRAVVPVCVAPVSPKLLPVPMSIFQAYNWSESDLLGLLEALAGNLVQHQLWPADARPSLTRKPMSATQPARSAGPSAEAIALSVDAAASIDGLLSFRKATGEHLAGLYSSYAGFVDMDAMVRCDASGHCQITRRYTIHPEQPIFHWYYQIFIDKPGKIEFRSAAVLEPRQAATIILCRNTEISAHAAILLPQPVPGEHRVMLEVTAYAENYLSDLFDKGLAQQYYRSSGRIRVRSNRERFEFPEDFRFSKLRCIVADSPDHDLIGKEIPPSFDEGAMAFDLHFRTAQGHSGIDLIEFRLG